jgi:hypothetical protein
MNNFNDFGGVEPRVNDPSKTIHPNRAKSTSMMVPP